MEKRKILIIGSGPAGYTAAIYAARANLEPLVVEGGFVPGNQSVLPGGQLMITTDVENFPGFPEGVMGPDLMDKMRAQAERFGTKVVHGFVTAVDLSQRPFKVSIEGELKYEAEALIIATGAVARLLEIPGERELMGHGVSACATCDGAFFRDKDVVVAGGGDTAMEEANFLTRFAKSVTIVHRRAEFRASKVMVERAEKNPKIRFLLDSVIEACLGEKPATIGAAGGLKALRIKHVKTGETHELKTDGFFVAIGHKPNTEIFEGQLDLDAAGYIQAVPGRSMTSVEGVFACGDVKDSIYRQAISAAGSGCMAAIDCERWLESLEG